MIETYIGTHDTLCPITLTPVHELEHPVAFKNALAYPFELDALVRWMTISDIHPTTRLLMPSIYDVKALLLDSQIAAHATGERILSYYDDTLARYLTNASSARVIGSMATMTMEQMESMLHTYVAKVDKLTRDIQELREDNKALREDNKALREENGALKERSTWWTSIVGVFQ
jgi:outer membrane murein-binding lipoprotein Lpp